MIAVSGASVAGARKRRCGYVTASFRALSDSTPPAPDCEPDTLAGTPDPVMHYSCHMRGPATDACPLLWAAYPELVLPGCDSLEDVLTALRIDEGGLEALELNAKASGAAVAGIEGARYAGDFLALFGCTPVDLQSASDAPVSPLVLRELLPGAPLVDLAGLFTEAEGPAYCDFLLKPCDKHSPYSSRIADLPFDDEAEGARG
ncbi:MAG: hypothetical protein ACI9K2_007456 [Myxococcota bacterium]|jgi:hypothetical protein